MVVYLLVGVLWVFLVWFVRVGVVLYRLRRNAVAYGSHCKRKLCFLKAG